MCRYSLEASIEDFGIVDATQGDTLEIRRIHGFQRCGEDAVVCLRPGTELTLSGEVIDWHSPDGRICEDARDQTVTFEERELPTQPHLGPMDILVRPDGRYAMIRHLCRGSTARVLQMPASGVSAPVRELELT